MSDILIAAHNEEATIYDIVKSAIASRCGKCIVVADNCTDRTASLASTAGAHVVTGEWGDKGSAVERGLAAVDTQRVILFDADLIGVEPHHFEQLDLWDSGMTVGIRGAAWDKYQSRNLSPSWSIGGERCLPVDTLNAIELRNAKYKLEMRINHRARVEHLRTRWQFLDGVDHVADYNKTPLVPAAVHDITRWGQVAIGWLEGWKERA